MIAVDTGFLFALVDKRDAWHERARAQAFTAAEGWITTWPVLTEATHLMTRWLGIDFAAALMDDVGTGGLAVWEPPTTQWPRLPSLMRRYAKLPMDLADASLVLLAGHLGDGRILSTDERDFRTYRWKNRKPFHNLLA
ncbi:MAG: PIN domain-containing protein [Caldimonas sp.]|nr:PIN domain-containing protein [Pseudomonadota bacterium]